MITREPRPGDLIEYGTKTWVVHHVRDNICYSQADEGRDKKCFIYQFPNGQYNHLHTIVGKEDFGGSRV